jgi:8-oxo-dGTP pyrophosphatase MutT (NUDIX family)
MKWDLCVRFDGGVLNVRAGAIILKDGKVLMVGNDRTDYLYSVGGRIKFGESAEEAVVREVFEETGVKMEIDRLGFIHENFFVSHDPGSEGKTVHEITLYFYMKTPEDFEPKGESFTEYESRENLTWVSPESEVKLYPEFFRSELVSPTETVKHFVTDDR